MAETPFPSPQTSQFNPSAWNIEGLTEDEETYLDGNFVRFPNAQSGVVFPDAPSAPTLAPGTATNQVATTGFVQNAITAFKAASNVWSGIQTFSAGITTATISAISGTFTLTGATTVSNGTFSGTTTLSNPFTPGYLYNVTTGTGAGKIGEIVNYTGSTAAITFTANSPLQIMSLTGFTPGTWLMTASVNGGSTPANVYMTIAISTTTTDVTSADAFGIEYMTGGGFGITSSLSCIIQSTSASTVYFVNAQRGLGGSATITPAGWRSIRIA